MDKLGILWQNKEFMMGTYNFSPLVLGLLVLALVDLGMKGWGMWRAARMGKRWWFVALLIVNSAALLPLLFLWMTNEEYTKMQQVKKSR